MESKDKQRLVVTCHICKVDHIIMVDPIRFSDYMEGKIRFAQDAFPELSPDQRELIISATCGKCWDKMFPDED